MRNYLLLKTENFKIYFFNSFSNNTLNILSVLSVASYYHKLQFSFFNVIFEVKRKRKITNDYAKEFTFLSFKRFNYSLIGQELSEPQFIRYSVTILNIEFALKFINGTVVGFVGGRKLFGVNS